jgi:hypothetical protein
MSEIRRDGWFSYLPLKSILGHVLLRSCLLSRVRLSMVSSISNEVEFLWEGVVISWLMCVFLSDALSDAIKR